MAYVYSTASAADLDEAMSSLLKPPPDAIPQFHVKADGSAREDPFSELDALLVQLDAMVPQAHTQVELARGVVPKPAEPSLMPVWSPPLSAGLSGSASSNQTPDQDSDNGVEEDDDDRRVVRSGTAPLHSLPAVDEGAAEKFKFVADELVTTEASYNERLCAVLAIADDMKPGQLLGKALTIHEHQTIFNGVAEMSVLSRRMLGHLFKYKPERFGRVLKDYVPHLQSRYAGYTMALPNALAMLQTVSQRKQVARYLEENARQKPQCHRLQLKALLAEPIQRCCRYPLLLGEMTNNIPPGAPHRKEFERAVDAVARMVVSVNERTRGAEWALQWVRNLHGSEGLGLERKLLSFVRHGTVNVRVESGPGWKLMDVVLFGSILLWSEGLPDGRWRMLGYMNVADLRAARSKKSDRAIEVVEKTLSGTSITLKFETLTLMDSWLDDLQEAMLLENYVALRRKAHGMSQCFHITVLPVLAEKNPEAGKEDGKKAEVWLRSHMKRLEDSREKRERRRRQQ